MPTSSHLENANITAETDQILTTGAPTQFLYTAPINDFWIDSENGADDDFENFDGTTPGRAFETMFRLQQILRSYRINPTATVTIHLVANDTPYIVNDFYFPQAEIIITEEPVATKEAIIVPSGSFIPIDVSEPLIFDTVRIQSPEIRVLQASNFALRFENCNIDVEYFNIQNNAYVVLTNNTFFGGAVGATNSNGTLTWFNVSNGCVLDFNNNTFDGGFAPQASANFVTLLGGSRAFITQAITAFSPLANVNAFSFLQIDNASTGAINRFGTSEVRRTTGAVTNAEINYDNSTSGLAATTLETAIDEVVAKAVNIPGPFVDDAAAAGGGVAVGQPYYVAAGTVQVRLV